MNKRSYTRKELLDWLVRIHDQQCGKDSIYGPTKKQFRLAKFRPWEEKPLYKDFLEEFLTYEGIIEAGGYEIPPEEVISADVRSQPQTEPVLEPQPEPQPEIELQPESVVEVVSEKEPDASGSSLEPEEKRPKGGKSKFSEMELAKILFSACEGEDSISISQYNAWREKQKGNFPTFYPFYKRLGNGKWRDAFVRMRELLKNEPSDTLEPNTPESEPILTPETQEEETAMTDQKRFEKIEDSPAEAVKKQPEKRPDEQCLEDVRQIAAKLPDGEYLTTGKYNELREPGMLSDKALRDRFECKWQEVLILADVMSASQEEPTQEPVPESTPELLALLPSYRFVNLLDYECKLNFGQPESTLQANNTPVVIKVQNTFTLDDRGACIKDTEVRIVLERSGQTFDLPEPQPGIFYLIDPRFYAAICNAIPENVCRSDLVPVYQTKYPEATPAGLYVPWRTPAV